MKLRECMPFTCLKSISKNSDFRNTWTRQAQELHGVAGLLVMCDVNHDALDQNGAITVPFRLDRMSVRACANTTDNNANKISQDKQNDIKYLKCTRWGYINKMIKNKGIYIMNIS